MATNDKLRGALLGMVIAAAVLAVVGLFGMTLAFERLRELGARYEIAVVFITIWSVVFVAMTMMRLPATPIVASAGLIVWIGYRLAVALATAGWPLVVDLLGEIVMVAGFCGYMAGGSRANAYYRRRLPAP